MSVTTPPFSSCSGVEETRQHVVDDGSKSDDSTYAVLPFPLHVRTACLGANEPEGHDCDQVQGGH